MVQGIVKKEFEPESIRECVDYMRRIDVILCDSGEIVNVCSISWCHVKS